MKNFYDPAVKRHFLQRIDQLHPNSAAQWGKMDVAQMMAHCSAALETAVGDRMVKPNLFERLFGRFFRGMLTSEKPFDKNLPTTPDFKMVDARQFDAEKIRLTQLVSRFSDGGEAGATVRQHPFFGTMNPQNWSNLMYKHLDHHLQQFGV